MARCLKSFWEKVFGKILKSLIINNGLNPKDYSITRRHRLLGQTTKQPLSNVELQKPWKYKRLWELDWL